MKLDLGRPYSSPPQRNPWSRWLQPSVKAYYLQYRYLSVPTPYAYMRLQLVDLRQLWELLDGT